YLGSATAPQTLGNAVMASTGSTNTPLAYRGMRRGSTSANLDAVGAFPQDPLGVMPETAPWVTVLPLRTPRHHSRGASRLWSASLDPDGLPLGDRGSWNA